MDKYYCKNYNKWNKRVLAHFGLHNAVGANKHIAVNSNAGDTSLFSAVMELFDYSFGCNKWILSSLWNEINQKEVDYLNSEADAIVLGGGGLLLRDQKGADSANSGWQWNCPVDMLSKFKVPIIIFAIGYNRFRDQPEFDPIFSEHITELVRISDFFSLRNSGSIRAVGKYLLDESLKSKLILQPCPTTVIWHIYEDMIKKFHTPKVQKNMAINIAFDRRDMRFDQDEDKIMADISRVIKKYNDSGWNIVLANHKPQDNEFSRWLDKEGVRYKAVDLSQYRPEEIIKFYSDKRLTVGMRGHSQMIPFGLRKNILSIVSHDKLKWFLEDIDHPEWGVDVRENDFKNKFDEKIQEIGGDRHEEINQELISAQEKIWNLTQENMKKISQIIIKL